MDSEVLYVMLFIIFIIVISCIFIFSKCKFSCGVREEFACQCTNGTPQDNWLKPYCNSPPYGFFKGQDLCKSCDPGYKREREDRDYIWAGYHNQYGSQYRLRCIPDPSYSEPAPEPEPEPAPASAPACRSCEDDSRERYGTACPAGYPTCQDIPSSYKKSNKNNFILGDKVEVSNQNCDWQETTDTKKIKRYDDKMCSNATDYIDQSSIGSGRGAAQAMTIKDLSTYCNSIDGCYGWARDNQQGDHKVKICKKGTGSTDISDNSRYDVYTCNSDYVCPAGYELKFNSNENKYECSICPEGKYKSGKNANNCVPCKSSCPAGKQLGGTCPSGSTSDTKTCTNIPGTSYEQQSFPTLKHGSFNYTGYYPNTRKIPNSKLLKRLGINNLTSARDQCNTMGDDCAAIYAYQYGNKMYYYAVDRTAEDKVQQIIANGEVTTDEQPFIIFNGGMKYKYVK